MLKSPYPSNSPYLPDADIQVPNSPYTVHDADTLRIANDPRAKRLMGVNAYEMFNPNTGTPRKLLAREGTEYTANELASGGVQAKNYGPDKSGRRDVVDVNTNNGNLAENLLKNHLATPMLFGNVPEDQKRKLSSAYTGADIAFDNRVPNPYADKIRAVPTLASPASAYGDYILPKARPQGALARGADIAQQSLYGAAGLAGRAVGNKDLQNWGEKNANAQDKEIAANPAKFPSYKDVHGVGDAVGYVGERIGESIPSMLPMMAGGALGVAGRTVLGGLSKSLAGSLGAFAGGVPMHAGEIEHDQQSRPNPVSPGKVLAGAALNSALDTVGAGVAVERLLTATAAKGVKDVAKQLLTSAALSVPVEGGTEAAQEATKVALHAAQDPNFQPLGKDKAAAVEQITEAGVGGAAAGLGMGVLSRSVGVGSKTLRAQDEIKTKSALDEDNKSIEAAAKKPLQPKGEMKMEGGKEQVEVTKAIQDKLDAVKKSYTKQAGFNEIATAAPALLPKLKNQFQENLGDLVHNPHRDIAIQANTHLRDFADKLNDLRGVMKPKDFQDLLKSEGINLDAFKDTGYDHTIQSRVANNRFATPEQRARAQARIDRQQIIQDIFNDSSNTPKPNASTAAEDPPAYLSEGVLGTPVQETVPSNVDNKSVDEQPTSITTEPTTSTSDVGRRLPESTGETLAANSDSAGRDPGFNESGLNTAGVRTDEVAERPSDSVETEHAQPIVSQEESTPVDPAPNQQENTDGEKTASTEEAHAPNEETGQVLDPIPSPTSEGITTEDELPPGGIARMEVSPDRKPTVEPDYGLDVTRQDITNLNDQKEALNAQAKLLQLEPTDVRDERVTKAEDRSIQNELTSRSKETPDAEYGTAAEPAASDSYEINPHTETFHGSGATRSSTQDWESQTIPYVDPKGYAAKKLVNLASKNAPGEYSVVGVDQDGKPSDSPERFIAVPKGSTPEDAASAPVKFELVKHSKGWVVRETANSFDVPNGEVSDQFINTKIAEARKSATQNTNKNKGVYAASREVKLPVIEPDGTKTHLDTTRLMWLGRTMNNGSGSSMTKGDMNLALRTSLGYIIDKGYKLGHNGETDIDLLLDKLVVHQSKGGKLTFSEVKNHYPDTLYKGNESETSDPFAGEGNTYGEKEDDNTFQIEKNWQKIGSSKSNPAAESSVLPSNQDSYHSNPKLVGLARSVAKLVGLRPAFQVADEEGLQRILDDIVTQGKGLTASLPRLQEELDVAHDYIKQRPIDDAKATLAKTQARIQSLRQTYTRLSNLKEAGIVYNDSNPNLLDREAVIFIPKGTKNPVLKLAHEMGHLLKREYVDQLIASNDPDAKAVVKELFGEVNWDSEAEALAADEMFARNTERWLSTNAKPRNVVEQFFKGLAAKLKQLYNKMRPGMEASKEAAFDKFMDAVIYERGEVSRPYKGDDPYHRAVASLVSHERLPFRPKSPQQHNYNGLLDVDRARDAGKWIGDNLAPVGDFMAKASPVWMSADAELRSYGSVGEWLANHFHIRPGQEGVVHGHRDIPAEIQAVGAKWYIKAAKLIDKLPDPGPKILALSAKSQADYEAKAKKMREIAKELVLGSTGKQDHEYAHQESGDIAKFFEEIKEHFNDEYSLNIKHRMNYFPLVFDKANMQTEASQKLWIKTLVDTGKFTPKQAAKIFEGIRNSDGALVDEPEDIENGTVLGSALSAKYARVFEDDVSEALANAGFYSTDIGAIVTQYTHALIKRAVEQKHFGGFKTDELGLAMRDADGNMIYSPTGALDARLKLATSLNQITPDQRKRIAKVILPGLMGRLGANISPETRAVMSWTQTALNVALLPFAWFSSIADVAGLGQAAGVHKAPVKAMTNVMKAFVDSLGNKEKDAYRKMLTNDLGAIRDAMVEHVLADSSSMEYMTPGTQKINDAFFRAIQMKRWTDYIRVASARLAVNDIQDMYHAGDDKGLEHFSLNHDDVKAWMDAGMPLEGIMYNHENVGYAINRWMDEASIRPKASLRPTWGSDHRMALLWYLKGFMWGYYETIGRKMFSHIRDAEGAMKMVPLITLGAMALPLAAAGYELRKILGEDVVSAVTGLPNMRNDPDNYWLEMLYRSGLLGPSDLLRQMVDAGDHGQLAFTAAGGPVVAKFVEAFDHGLFDTIATTLPGVAQSSTLRTAVKNGIGYD